LAFVVRDAKRSAIPHSHSVFRIPFWPDFCPPATHCRVLAEAVFEAFSRLLKKKLRRIQLTVKKAFVTCFDLPNACVRANLLTKLFHSNLILYLYDHFFQIEYYK
jgi:hypothetical protein